MKNPGKVIQHKDGQRYIVYNRQPLMQDVAKERIILTFVDENLLPEISQQTGKPKTLLKSYAEWVEFIKECKLIGYIN